MFEQWFVHKSFLTQDSGLTISEGEFEEVFVFGCEDEDQLNKQIFTNAFKVEDRLWCTRRHSFILLMT